MSLYGLCNNWIYIKPWVLDYIDMKFAAIPLELIGMIGTFLSKRDRANLMQAYRDAWVAFREVKSFSNEQICCHLTKVNWTYSVSSLPRILDAYIINRPEHCRPRTFTVKSAAITVVNWDDAMESICRSLSLCPRLTAVRLFGVVQGSSRQWRALSSVQTITHLTAAEYTSDEVCKQAHLHYQHDVNFQHVARLFKRLMVLDLSHSHWPTSTDAMQIIGDCPSLMVFMLCGTPVDTEPFHRKAIREFVLFRVNTTWFGQCEKLAIRARPLTVHMTGTADDDHLFSNIRCTFSNKRQIRHEHNFYQQKIQIDTNLYKKTVLDSLKQYQSENEQQQSEEE